MGKTLSEPLKVGWKRLVVLKNKVKMIKIKIVFAITIDPVKV